MVNVIELVTGLFRKPVVAAAAANSDVAPVVATPAVDNVAKFVELVRALDHDNNIEVGHTSYLDKPVRDRLFTGTDCHGRVFVNLPITITASEKISAQLSKRNAEVWKNSAFVVFQRYTDNKRTFVLGGNTQSMPNFLGEDNEDFSMLEKLLAGETLRFHETMYTADYKTVLDNPDSWVEITLKR